MKYSKREVRELLDNGTHILKVDCTERFTELVKGLYPKDNYFEMNTIKNVGGCYLMTSINYRYEWYWTSLEKDRTVILFSDIEKDEVVWLGNELQWYAEDAKKWIDAPINTKYRLRPKKSDDELELERLAEELGYNLTKK